MTEDLATQRDVHDVVFRTPMDLKNGLLRLISRKPTWLQAPHFMR
jgi:hypothetical protein